MLNSVDTAQVETAILLSYATALNLRVGLFSVAPAAFAGVGAYGFGILTTAHDVSTSVGLVYALLMGALGGLLLALLIVRVRGVYAAVVTIALVVMLSSLEASLSITGGSIGYPGIPFADTSTMLAIAIAVVVIINIVIDRSQWGRGLDLVGRDALLAESVGVSSFKVRLFAVIASSALAAFAGAAQAHSIGYIAPTDFSFNLVILITAYAVAGGVYHWFGPLVGAGVLALLNTSIFNLGTWADVIIGGILAITVILLPDGASSVLRRLLRPRMSRRLSIARS